MSLPAHRPPLNRFSKKILVSERLPEKMGYYRVSFKRSKMLADHLFVPDDATCKKLWIVQIDWWYEEIPEPFAVTKEEAILKLEKEDYSFNILLQNLFLISGNKNRKPTSEEIHTFKNLLKC